MPKVLFTTSSFDLNNFKEIDLLNSLGFESVINPYGKRLTEDQVASLLDEDVVGMVAGLEPLTDRVLRGAKGLKVISRCGIGIDNVDTNAVGDLGIALYNTPDAPTRAVAELTLAHILSLSRRISESDRMVRNGEWQSLMGSLLSRQTVGLIGFGRIGKMVKGLLEAFGTEVIFYDKYYKSDGQLESLSLNELLTLSDIVSVHVPYDTETHHIINADSIRLMKPGAVLINVARGGLIDEKALLEALKSGKLSGAALDCFETEPYDGPLTKLKNVQISAHMGSYAKEARSMMETEACKWLMEGLRKQGIIKD
jgi:D-3-phosphoglycerate dehydrogenase